MEALLTLLQVLSVLALLGNFVGNVMVLTLLRKVQSMQTNTNFLLGSLAASDLQFGVFVFVEIALYYELGEGAATYAFSFQISYRVYVSAFTLAAIAVERYYAILKPFVHRAKTSKKLMRRMCVVIWLLATALSVPESVLAGWGRGVKERYAWLAYTVCVVVSGAIMTACYGRIVYRVWFRTQESKTTNAGVLKSRKNLTKLLVTVTLVFFACFCPLLGRSLVSANHRRLYVMCSGTFALVGTSANPLLYTLHSARFRRALHELFGGARCCKRISVGGSTVHPATVRTDAGGHSQTKTPGPLGAATPMEQVQQAEPVGQAAES